VTAGPPEMVRSTAWSRRASRALRLVGPLALLAIVLRHTGTEPFRQCGAVLGAEPIAAALGLGLVATTAQALRWRAVTIGLAPARDLPAGRALLECYRAVFLNTALPGGLAGDAVRAWRQRHCSGTEHPDLRLAAGTVVVERLTGTVLLFAAAALTTLTALPVDPRLGAATGVVAVAAAVLAAPGWVRLPGRARWAVLGWSALALAAWVALITIAADRLGTTHGRDVVPLALIVLAGSSIPLGFAGFGPRETAAAVGYAAAGLPAASGVATAAGFGVLAVVSVLPGGLVLLVDILRNARTGRAGASRRGEVELDADVLADLEPSHRGA